MAGAWVGGQQGRGWYLNRNVGGIREAQGCPALGDLSHARL